MEVVSHMHGKYIYEIGSHILPYFLNDWERFKHIPLGVRAHSTRVRGSGMMDNGIEKPNVHVTLSSRISAEDCARLNLVTSTLPRRTWTSGKTVRTKAFSTFPKPVRSFINWMPELVRHFGEIICKKRILE